MLSRVAHVLLVATSLAPISLIYGVSRAGDGWTKAAPFIGGAFALAVLCHVVLGFAARHGEVEQVQVAKSKSVDREALGFVVSYALPLVVPTDKHENVLALIAFVAVVFVVLFQVQLAHVNPLLALFRYRFFEVSPPTGETAMLITRRHGESGPTRIVKLSTLLWLELPT